MSTPDDFNRLLEACAREPIHIPGAIQPQGSLLAVNQDTGAIQYVAENSDHYIGLKAEDLLGEQAEKVFGRANWNLALHGLEQPAGGAMLSSGLNGNGPQFCSVHRAGDYIVVEIEPLEQSDLDVAGLQDMQEELLDQTSSEELFQTGVEHARSLTGYEHVMLYRFHDNWDGEVIAEVVGKSLPAYLGHRFPASDIPKQARKLYSQQTFRIIPDAKYVPVSLLSNVDEPLDLSHAWLRSVSPVHLKYLENMGVGASLSISVIVDDHLWGLVACHHPEPRQVSPQKRRAAALYGRLFSAQLKLQLASEKQRYIAARRDVYRLPHQFVRANVSLTEHLQEHGSKLLQLVEAGGAAFSILDEMGTIEQVPPTAAVEALMDWIQGQEFEHIWHTDHLSGFYGGGDRMKEVASGVLAMRLPGEEGQLFVWFRPEVLQTVMWGGNPHQPLLRDGEQSERLSPRNSFETWKEQRRGYSMPWRPEHLEAASEFRPHLLEAVITETRRQASEQLGIVHQVLGHDIRNSVSVTLMVSEMLAKRVDPELSGLANQVLEASRRITDLTRSLHSLSEAMAGVHRLERTQVDLVSLLRRQVEHARKNHREATIQFTEPNVDTHHEYVVHAGSLLDSVFRNLIGNAVIHNETPGAVVRVEAVKEGSSIRVEVADNGPGIPDADRTKIFRRGYTSREGNGTGLGLYLVRMIVEQYEGRVYVQDNDPEGAIFVVELPRANPS